MPVAKDPHMMWGREARTCCSDSWDLFSVCLFFFSKKDMEKGKYLLFASTQIQKLGLRIKIYDLVTIRLNFTYSVVQMKLF